MRAYGNGAIQVCADNLLRMFVGECPFERVKGLNPRIIDKPISELDFELNEDAEFLIETYEPRAVFEGVEVKGANPGVDGGLSITAVISKREEE